MGLNMDDDQRALIANELLHTTELVTGSAEPIAAPDRGSV
jgi:hypothetical protein